MKIHDVVLCVVTSYETLVSCDVTAWCDNAEDHDMNLKCYFSA
jgi:hypothetical protein